MVNKDLEIYIAITDVERFEMFNGYTARSQSKDHFIKHLGYRYSKKFDLDTINKACTSNDIKVFTLWDLYHKVTKEGFRFDKSTEYLNLKIVDVEHFMSEYAYILVITYNNGCVDQMEFVDEMEAREWFISHKTHLLL